MKINTLDRKKFRIRNKLKKFSTLDRFRLSVSRSSKNISAQIIDDKKNNAVLLGGSTAFGYYSSSDKTTPAALLSKNSNLNFYNLNGPSWNSHQELISLIKFKKDYDISLSLTGVTDLSIFCQYTFE